MSGFSSTKEIDPFSMDSSGMHNTYKYTISVVILSYNRAHQLGELLRGLLQQDISEDLYEIIVSDDGSTDNTRKVVRNMQKKNKNIVFLGNHHQGVGNSRNQGLRIASRDLVIFLADDYEISSGFLRSILSIFSHTDIDILKLGIGHRVPHDLINRLMYTYDYINEKRIQSETIWPSSNQYKQFNLHQIHNFTYSNRCVFKKSVFTEIGEYRMAEKGEDTDLAERIKNHSFRIYYCPDIQITHGHIYTWPTIMTYYFQKGKGIRILEDLPYYESYIPKDFTRTFRFLKWYFRHSFKIALAMESRIKGLIYYPFFLFINSIQMIGCIYYCHFNKKNLLRK